jgi:hypothetical protein
MNVLMTCALLFMYVILQQKKNVKLARLQWLTPVILAIQETETRKTVV